MTLGSGCMRQALVGATLVLLLALYLGFSSDNNTKIMSDTPKFERLPSNVVPKKYTLNLDVDLAGSSFSGTQVVEVEVKTATNTIVLNSKDLQVSEVSFVDEANASVAAQVELDEKRELATFTFPSALKPGKGRLHAKFVGGLNDKLKGFYRSKYTLEGEQRYMAVTQFEPTDARRAFPCWDEPAVKATFDVTLVVPKNRLAISNMPVVSESDVSAERKSVRFAETPIMSTYLLAFIVGEFDYLEDKTTSGVVVRCYTPVGKKEQGRFALQVAVKTLPFYDEYFGTPYPLPKMDLLAIPDFAAGAMENWGCVTYRETALLVDPQNTSTAAKQYVALVVGHELAHQWFGNLVTMEWWTHLWLNEGFASWIEYLCVDHCFPEWDIWTQFVYADLGNALTLDGLKNSHPVEVPINDPAEIDEIFDAISYSKGCSIIRMLANWLGMDAFKKGLQQYLQRFKYSNALTEDLWEYLEKASGKPVKALMDTWTKQTGYPVLTVEETASPKGGRAFKITQSRFLSSGPVPDDTTQWQVPLGITTQSAPTQPHFEVLSQRESVVTLPNAGPNDWIKFNPSTTGFFRIKYPAPVLEKLRVAVEKHDIAAIDRLGVQNDILSLAKAGFISASEALTVVKSFQHEIDYTVWADLTTKLHELEILASNTDFYPLYKEFGRNLYKRVAESVGWDPKESDAHSVSMLRPLALSRLGRYGDAPTAAEAQKRLTQFLSDRNSLPADLRGAVYSIVLSNFPTSESYEAVLRIFRETDLQEERVRCLRALGTVADTQLLEKTLEMALSSDVRSQDAVFVIESVAANSKGRELAWAFIQRRWSDLNKMYEGGFLLTRLIRATSEFASEEKAAEIESFFKANPVAGGERTVKQTVEKIRSTAAWLKRDAQNIRAWLESNAKY